MSSNLSLSTVNVLNTIAASSAPCGDPTCFSSGTIKSSNGSYEATMTWTQTGNNTGGASAPAGDWYVGDYPDSSGGLGSFTVPNTTIPIYPTGGIYPPFNPPPIAPGPFTFPPTPIQIPVIPEDGTYDVPGGKVIIKRILITEEEIEKAAEKEFGHKPTKEEMDKIKKELEDAEHFEEREV